MFPYQSGPQICAVNRWNNDNPRGGSNLPAELNQTAGRDPGANGRGNGIDSWEPVGFRFRCAVNRGTLRFRPGGSRYPTSADATLKMCCLRETHVDYDYEHRFAEHEHEYCRSSCSCSARRAVLVLVIESRPAENDRTAFPLRLLIEACILTGSGKPAGSSEAVQTAVAVSVNRLSCCSNSNLISLTSTEGVTPKRSRT